MPSNIPATTIRIEPGIKKEATAFLDELGLSMSTAVNAFLKALVREQGMPFEMDEGRAQKGRGVAMTAQLERERERVDRRFAPIWTTAGRWS